VAAETFAEIMWRKSGISDLMRTRRMLVRASRRILSDSFEVDVSARERNGRRGRLKRLREKRFKNRARLGIRPIVPLISRN